MCPDGVVFSVNKVYQVNLDYCKGCGICAEECPVKDIQMVREVK
jgi:Pyruvate/2-oxoacid:ferredoxin oxidoreductase delta subunit